MCMRHNVGIGYILFYIANHNNVTPINRVVDNMELDVWNFLNIL